MLRYLYVITHEVTMRMFSIPPPTLLAGFLAVLIGYASSAAIIWQAAIVAGATTAQISGWMTALGLAMGVSTLTLTLWYRVPVLTAWSTPGAALLVTGLQGLTLNEAIGVFIVTNVLIVLCGITGLFARLMRIIPHSLAAAMLAGILLRFGLQAFASLDGQFTLCGSMLLAAKAVAPRYAVIAAMIIGIVIVIAQGDVVTNDVDFKPVLPTYITPDFSFAHSLSVALPLFLVTMASQNAPGIAAMKAAGYSAPVSPLIVFTGLLALFFSPFGVYSVGIAAITAAICQSPEAHPDKDQRWLAAAVAGIFYLIAGLFGSAITGMMAALPVSWIQMLAGLALLSTIGGSLYQALHNERERDAAVVAFLVTASGLTLFGIGSAFWGLIAGGVCYVVLNLIANRNR
ncbi:TPA: BenE family transporter YdcO [Escherichia coli]|uniref:BenE family transporter YdcO n=1 Tax=Escherichia coli TaxID=562 RepID=UPI00290C81DB|nr:BenE family transporter YdcO [Escherichia coli]HDJ8539771.1 BenE family transporter YdcO [Escherichia coli]HDJ8544131.1 BenE family transporter YdcO [Escherichia coli]HDJ8548730.1 BenE family transporter YdcO [Escherichia coli]HEB2684152.1 BenE family transporter YdcO [Escherichia coli]